jgi:hypothetical protein
MARRIKKINGYRSKFENSIGTQLSEHKINPKKIYETTVIDYVKPKTHHTYTVDFALPNGILIEAKGRWVLEDRKKHMLIRDQHPELDIRFVFMNSKGKIRKGSKTTYADFCNKHGILWADKVIPNEWLKSKK